MKRVPQDILKYLCTQYLGPRDVLAFTIAIPGLLPLKERQRYLAHYYANRLHDGFNKRRAIVFFRNKSLVIVNTIRTAGRWIWTNGTDPQIFWVLATTFSRIPVFKRILILLESKRRVESIVESLINFNSKLRRKGSKGPIILIEDRQVFKQFFYICTLKRHLKKIPAKKVDCVLGDPESRLPNGVPKTGFFDKFAKESPNVRFAYM